MSVPFGVFVPLGPGEAEVLRAADLLDSLWCHEPGTRWVLVIDDDPSPRDLSVLPRAPRSCEITVLRHPRNGRGDGLMGGLCAANLVAMDWFERHTSAAFFVKLDTDALVTGSFADRLGSCLSDPKVGIIGTLGRTCNRDSRERGFYADAAVVLYQALQLVPGAVEGARGAPRIEQMGAFGPEQVGAFALVRPHFTRALCNGYVLGEYCQGGGYAVTRAMIERMSLNGYLTFWSVWTDVPCGEDVMMGMYARAVGLRLHDASGAGGVFAVQHRGLPYTPDQILRDGYGIVHSLKHDAVPEDDLRRLFRSRRRRPAGVDGDPQAGSRRIG